MKLAAVTGTNGKTTTTFILEAMLQAAGASPGVIGTVTYRHPGGARPAPLTTPGAVQYHGLLAEMYAAGARHVVLEASSHALEQGRVAGRPIDVAGLTNLTQDHLDYHGDMETYFQAKARLFDRYLAEKGVAVLPADRPEGRRLGDVAKAARPGAQVLWVGAAPTSDVTVSGLVLGPHGTCGRLCTPIGSADFQTPLVGDFNVANILLATGMGIGLAGVSLDAIIEGLRGLTGVPGRLEQIPNNRGSWPWSTMPTRPTPWCVL